jgi:hypothetical protein
MRVKQTMLLDFLGTNARWSSRWKEPENKDLEKHLKPTVVEKAMMGVI